ncbi:MAG: FKBP-type peptidyl-prolyl cis-trans isomerase [Oceanospirillales bacterium]|uniref:Peptidyl-prolyl cis-trans isomerase n=1 Tax=Marinobacterium halophilum TaxID=267374 RepID=A0A2P8EY79_9GAMM|nr:FKBP-type peptidyl-prolyl cis-trans isomerase [Marinobacterium halophilum]MBR9828439.1 FKBP-type peptidyl-prolyl cis-trans isomerase [Oceanospirillales bacterium]PSL14414.1 FKBP-type peptidyl-prolyl cis-trans isomerase FklB [Marinobacterium halophilum]
MKKSMLAIALSGALVASAGVQAETLETEQQKLSYSLGLILGERLQADIDELDIETFTRGVEAVYKAETPLLDQEQVAEVMQAFQSRKMEEQRQAVAQLAQENLDKGTAYQTDNGKQKGVKTTESGLQYQVLEAGSGKHPTAEDTVKVHYRGQLIDGTEFDSSYARNEPVSFPLNGVIPGWTEGLQLMKEGGKSRLVIPAELAYGPGGMGNAIGPNETLVFEVELLEINPSEDK